MLFPVVGSKFLLVLCVWDLVCVLFWAGLIVTFVFVWCRCCWWLVVWGGLSVVVREGWFGCDCLCDFFGDCVLILSCLAVWVLTYAFVVLWMTPRLCGFWHSVRIG